MAQKEYFPIFIDISQKDITVFGGGKIATRRIATLLSFGAKIKVITKTATEEIKNLAEENKILLQLKAYSPTDIENCFLVFAATDSDEVNNSIYDTCRKKGIIINCSHDKEKCDFYFPAVIREDDFVLGITSSGRDHFGVKKFADKIRRFLKENHSEEN